MIATVEDSVLAFFCELVCYKHTAETEDATRHMQLNIGTDIVFFECPSLEFVSGSFSTVFITQVLQGTLAGLVADGAVQRMVDQQEFHHALACIQNFFTRNIFYYHAIHDIGPAAGNPFGHGPWVGRRSGGYFHQAGAAFAPATFKC